MTVAALIRLVFAALVLITGFDWLRHRTRARLDIWLVFGCLLVPSLLPALAGGLGGTNPLFEIVAILAIMLQPFLLLRLVQHFHPVPRRVWLLTLLAMLVTLTVLVVTGESRPAVATGGVIVYFLVVESYPIWAFWRAARSVGGVVRRRLIFATVGTLLLALTVLLSGLPTLLPDFAGPARDLTNLSTLLAAVGYYVSFATPRALRRAWQLEELYSFLRAPVGVGVAGMAGRALDQLCRTATRTAGGLACAVWLWEAERDQLVAHASAGLVSPAPLALAEAGPLGTAWAERRPVVVPAAELPPGLKPTGPAAGAHFLAAVPVAAGERTWGVLGLFLQQRSLFPDDDVALLGLLADQTAETLALDALFTAERSLLERLALTNANLQGEVAERRQAQAALAQRTADMEELARSLEAVIENIPTMLFMKDAAELRFVRWNKACEEVVGLPRAEALGKDDYAFFPPSEAEFFIAKDREVLAGSEMVDIPEEIIHSVHQGVRVLHTRKVPIKDANGTPKFLLGISEDITERRQVEAQIQQLNDSLTQRAALLEAANQELEAFSYSVSHDLRSPLRAIDGFSQALLEDYYDQLDETAQDYLGRIRRGAQRMAQLIDDLLSLAWLSRATLTAAPLDLSALAQAVLAELRAAEPERVIETVVADGLRAYGDARLLRVALENLLGNAWKFTSREPQARLEVSGGQIGGQPVYCVRDNGAGFDMSSAERLFGAFQRMHTLEEFPGTGIGLAIVQRIIHRHGGRIWAESAPGQGAAFYFMLGPEGSE